jgi:excisionase family DNA binding protein
MKRYLVEVRLGYDVKADTADQALRLVSPAIQDDETIAVEYSVRERHEPAPAMEPKSPDLHGLTKPVYTVTEVASILGTSRSSVYELARRSASNTRLGRRVLIPRNTLVAFLNGELPVKEPVSAEPISTRGPIRRNPVKKSALPEAVTPVRQPSQKQAVKEKTSVSITEAARMLHISTTRLRELMDQRKIYFTEYYGKRTIPKKAIENFANGLPAITMLEENIAYYRANNQMDAEMEEIAAKLLAEWGASAADR